MQYEFSLNKALSIGIAVALMIFSGMLYMFYCQKKNENSSAFLIAQSRENLYQTSKLLSFVTDNETGSRGFLLTGDSAFLEPLVNSKQHINDQLALLRSLNKNNPEREKLLDSLHLFAEKRFSFSDTTIKMREEKGLVASAELVATSRGKFYLDQVRKIINQVTEDEYLLLKKRLKENETEAGQQSLKFLSAAFIIVVLMTLLLWSEKKRVQGKMKKKSSDELQFLSMQINQSNDAIYTLDANRKIKSWNLGAEKLYGFKEPETLDKESNALLQTVISSDEIMKAVIELDEKMYWAGELERKTKAGETIYVTASTSCIKNKDGVITGYVAVSRDITAQKKLNEQLNHLADIVEQSSEAIFSRDINQHIISWNDGAEKLFGYNKAEVMGKPISSLGILKLTASEINEVEKEIIEQGNWKAEKIYHHRNGTSFFGAVTANRIQNTESVTTSFNFIVKDISKRKELEEKLEKANEELEKKVDERTKAVLDKEKNYRYLFENNPLPMWVIDAVSFKFLDVNETALQHYGYSRNEFLTMTAVDIRPADAVEAFTKIGRSQNNNEIRNQGVWKHIKKDGTLISVEINSHPLTYEHKKSAACIDQRCNRKR